MNSKFWNMIFLFLVVLESFHLNYDLQWFRVDGDMTHINLSIVSITLIVHEFVALFCFVMFFIIIVLISLITLLCHKRIC